MSASSDVGLADVPDEVVVMISELVEPADFDAWLRVSKRTFQCSQKRLPRHKELKDLHSTYSLEYDHPAKLLHAIWSDHEVAHYIRKLDYTCDNQWTHDRVVPGELDLSEVKPATKQQLKICVQDLVASLPRPFRAMDMFADGDFAEGDETPAFALLLILLPNVNSLILRRPMWDPMKIRKVVLQARAVAAGLSRPLEKLHQVAIDADPEMGCPEQALLPLVVFINLPSLRSIAGWSIGSSDYSDHHWQFHELRLRKSSIKSLQLMHSDIQQRVSWSERHPFHILLGLMPDLERFYYHHGSENHPFNAGFIVDALVSSPAGACLEELSLSGDVPSSDSVPSLRSMRNLCELEIDADCFLTIHEAKPHLSEKTTMDKARWSGARVGAASSEEIVHSSFRHGTRSIARLVDVLPASLRGLRLRLGRLTDSDINGMFSKISDDAYAKKISGLTEITHVEKRLTKSAVHGCYLLDLEFAHHDSCDDIYPEHENAWPVGYQWAGLNSGD